MDYAFLWGLIALACGTVMIVYGSTMFRVVLAFAGFYIGFGLVSATLGTISGGPSPAIQTIIAIILGAALGGVLYSFASLVGIGGSWLLTVLALAGVGAGAFGGRYLGQWLTILSSAIAGPTSPSPAWP